MRYSFFFFKVKKYRTNIVICMKKILVLFHTETYDVMRSIAVVSRRYFHRTGYLTSYISIRMLSRTRVMYANAVTYEPWSYYVLSISLYRSPVTTDSAYDVLCFIFYLPHETSEHGNCYAESNKRDRLIACPTTAVIIL